MKKQSKSIDELKFKKIDGKNIVGGISAKSYHWVCYGYGTKPEWVPMSTRGTSNYFYNEFDSSSHSDGCGAA